VGETDRHPNPIELELADFRPRPISPDLQSRIGATLAGPRPIWRAGGALLASAAAACVVIAVGVTWSRGPTPHSDYVNTGTRPSTPLRGDALQSASSFPSLMDYQQAFGESSDAFDALLARPARRGSASEARSSSADVMTAFSDSIPPISKSTANGDLP
jgi:hypothetical protein